MFLWWWPNSGEWRETDSSCSSQPPWHCLCPFPWGAGRRSTSKSGLLCFYLPLSEDVSSLVLCLAYLHLALLRVGSIPFPSYVRITWRVVTSPVHIIPHFLPFTPNTHLLSLHTVTVHSICPPPVHCTFCHPDPRWVVHTLFCLLNVFLISERISGPRLTSRSYESGSLYSSFPWAQWRESC